VPHVPASALRERQVLSNAARSVTLLLELRAYAARLTRVMRDAP